MVKWTNVNTLKNAVENLNVRLEESSQKKGEVAANSLLEATRNYGGLWFFLRFPVSVIAGGVSLNTILMLAFGSQSNLLGIVALVFGTYFWYRARPLRVHPIAELVLVCTFGGVVTLAVSSLFN